MGLIRTVDAGTEPVTRDEAKDHLRIPLLDASEDSLVDGLIVAARQWAEHETNRALIEQTWRLTLDDFPRRYDGRRWPPEPALLGWSARAIDDFAIRIPRPQLIAVTSIKYVDVGGTLQTLASNAYVVDTDALPGRILPAFDTAWPDIRFVPAAVTVVYTAGYGADASSVPRSIKNAMLLRIGDLYRNREAQIVAAAIAENPTACALLAPFLYVEA